jgi:hypothetical protein
MQQGCVMVRARGWADPAIPGVGATVAACRSRSLRAPAQAFQPRQADRTGDRLGVKVLGFTFTDIGLVRSRRTISHDPIELSEG